MTGVMFMASDVRQKVPEIFLNPFQINDDVHDYMDSEKKKSFHKQLSNALIRTYN